MYNVRGSFDANFEPLLSGRQLRGGRSNYVEQLVSCHSVCDQLELWQLSGNNS